MEQQNPQTDAEKAAAEKAETGPAKSRAKADADETRYAVYDLTHGRFVGPVHDKKGDATKALKEYEKSLTPAHEYEIREV